MATTTKLAFISVLSDQELENAILTQKSELVNDYPFGILYLADDTLPCADVSAGIAGIQEPTAPSTIVIKLTRIIRMWSELAEFSHCAWIGPAYGVQCRIVPAYQDLF
jgi:hypothetical protein